MKEKNDKIKYLEDEFYDELNEFEEFTMFFINKLEAANKKTKNEEAKLKNNRIE